MTELKDLFARAVGEFDSRVKQIKDDQWDLPTPCSDWNVRDLVNHLVYEDLWAPPLLEGQTIEQVGDRFEGDMLGEAPVAAWDKARAETLDAASQPGAFERTVHLSRGETPAVVYLGELLNDHVIHAWDLARGIGADDKLDAELVEFLYEQTKPMEDSLKATGAFGDKVEVPEGSDTQTKLLAVMGRRA
jgi:uncharacterized protein (TIGR03086 family)